MVELLNRRERVVLAEDLAGVAEGTPGEVILRTGVRWVRYWVRFDTGTERGSIHRDKLVREDQWENFLAGRAEAAEQAASTEAAAGTESEELPIEGIGNGAVGDPDLVVNGVALPPHLLARSASARQRLGG